MARGFTREAARLGGLAAAKKRQRKERILSEFQTAQKKALGPARFARMEVKAKRAEARMTVMRRARLKLKI